MRFGNRILQHGLGWRYRLFQQELAFLAANLGEG